ncbi:hypothetical protein KY342_07060 [Candidatus Woesearchaeota archaeon]|nr:hypothetical protein [Candidatus Woesearchaeota archaeon]
MTWAMKPYVNINVDEALISQELNRQFKKGNAFIAVKDVGIDLVLIKNIKKKKTKGIRIQVKGSKYYLNKNPSKSGGWVTLSNERINQYNSMVDYIIFVVWEYDIYTKGKPIKFHPYFLIIPMNDFVKLVKKKKIEHGIGYSFYFRRQGKNAFEVRDENKKGRIDLTKYLNNWDVIK